MYLLPFTTETGESGMALLMLREIAYQQPYPSTGAAGLLGTLLGFTRRLQDCAVKDAELSQWLVWQDMSAPLCAGPAPSHHCR
jgi:hypothetical protein